MEFYENSLTQGLKCGLSEPLGKYEPRRNRVPLRKWVQETDLVCDGYNIELCLVQIETKKFACSQPSARQSFVSSISIQMFLRVINISCPRDFSTGNEVLALPQRKTGSASVKYEKFSN